MSKRQFFPLWRLRVKKISTPKCKYFHSKETLCINKEFPTKEKPDFFNFEVDYVSKKSRARVGRITTPHGIIDTPGFVAVGTNGVLKGITQEQAEEAGLQLMFCNTYHLMLQPGPKAIENAGGLHQFINRKQPIITDSGGFQVFSLAYGSVHDELSLKSQIPKGTSKSSKKSVLSITEEGVLFKSYRDGKEILLTPESSIQAQKAYGSDIIIPLDELPPYHITNDNLKESLLRTHRWESRSLKEHLKDIKKQAIYGVVHGGINRELRADSAEYIQSLPFDGTAIGGSVGRNKEEMLEMLQFLMPLLPLNRPNHLLGVADDKSVEQLIPLGIDTFDSCYPTKVARHGTVFSKERGRLSVLSSKCKQIYEPIDYECLCPACRSHSLAYLHHLFKSHEPTGIVLTSLHNLYYMCRLFSDYRNDIMIGKI